MRNPIYDNTSPEKRVQSWLEDHIHPDAHLRVASAYFTVGAFALLQAKLEAIAEMRFLFGDPKSVSELDPMKMVMAYDFQNGELKLNEQIRQNPDAQACAKWIEDKVAIRRVRNGRLSHGKLYHVQYPRGKDAIFGGMFEPKDSALVGSSNFTVSGLGGSRKGGNVELNLEAYDDRDRESLAAWFDGLWKNEAFTEDCKSEVLGYLNRLARDNAPEFVYYKTLFHLFEDKLAARLEGEKESAKWRDSQIWNALFEFQKHGAKEAVRKLEDYGGCILADSVGLGKTYTALAVIWFWEKIQRQDVLVLAPKKLRENWRIYQQGEHDALNPFPDDQFLYRLQNHTDLGLEKWRDFPWNKFGLVVIDESHNFRNNARGRDGKKSRYEFLMDCIVKSGAKTKVLLLSATPVNTDLKDLRNQIFFMTEDDDAAFREKMGMASLSNLTAQAQRVFTQWAEKPVRDPRDLFTALPAPFFTLLSELSIARSRMHIQKFYAPDLAKIGAFPKRAKPLSFATAIDLKGRFPSYDRLHRDISEYKLHLFNPSFYLKPAARVKYEARQAQAENHLIGMMRVNFLKRLESSVHSFAQTMERTIEKIEDLEKRIGEFEQFQSQNPHVSSGGLFESELEQMEDEDLRQAFEVSAGRFNLDDLELERWKKALQEDKQQLSGLRLAARDVDDKRDAKLAQLKEFIAGCVAEKTAPHERKVLIFTAFADTARYLYEHISGWAKGNWDFESGLVVGSGANAATFGKPEFNEILFHFAPRSKKREKMASLAQNGEISILIATDCISEGQNLQDCGLVVNYDIHWNPVRLIQRFGRVDRLGSLHSAIQMVNFWPTDDLNAYINLKNRVEARMALVDVAGTNQDNVLRGAAQELIAADLSFRDEQLLKLRDTTPDLEDLGGGVSLSDFTLDDFIAELLAFLETRRDELEAAPMGLFAVAPQNGKVPDAKPGIVFCLRRRGDAKNLKGKVGQSRFAPYFLTYIRTDGEVFYSFTDDKRLLSMLRGVCVGQKEPLDELCHAFESENPDMAAPLAFLEKVTQHIAATSKAGAAKGLAAGGVLATQSIRPSEDENWDLITWIVIQ